MMSLLTFLLMVHVSQAETQTGSCKDILHGFLSGQLSSALGDYQIKALKQEFLKFTNTMQQSMNVFKEQMKADFEKKGRINKSVVYTRWGKKTCPSNAELVLSGFTGGSHYTHSGAAVDPLCLPRDPEWGRYKDGADGGRAYVYGAEYETGNSLSNLRNLHDHDVPCAVCLVHNRSVLRVFPARKTCYKGWKLEYDGYLMAGYHTHPAATTYKCVDRKPDTITGGHSDQDGYRFYFVEAKCGSLKCPPYVNGRELVCAVCSKA
ncbi:short-chain collagen C4-like [Ostrea edulis]|uniref:short-chain collagen C4-like n=1 Tax=Ostrea edulis TaxID=37623 RepID=UPI0024AEB468|nr:short-chain collagen C4-like [Ostrea edulis]XP_056006028.1 short-chain collagen C4-like [Ostrea edulis]